MLFPTSRIMLAKLFLNIKHGEESVEDIYQTLDTQAQEVRVLNIAPGTGTEMVECQLQHVKLGDPTIQYRALSYTWGPRHRLQVIRLNGKLIHVTAGLEAALRRLRLPNQVQKLWVDALCINQKDSTERSHQVLKMGQIYLHATEVCIWLGKGTRTSRLAMNFILEGNAQQNMSLWFKETITNSLKRHERRWYSVLLLFRHEYWKRVWIIQEIAFAAGLQILCGDQVVPWESAVACAMAWNEAYLSCVPLRAHMADVAGVPTWVRAGDSLSSLFSNVPIQYEALPALDQSRKTLAKFRGKPASTLIVLLQSHHLALASDERDRMYALVSLASDCQTSSTPIDYDCSTWEAYLQIFEFLARCYGNLDFLVCSYAYNYDGMHLVHRSIYYGYPSWTPYFYWPQEAHMNMSCYKEGYIFTGSARPFQASGYDRTDAHFLRQTAAFEEPRSELSGKIGLKVILRVKGCRIEKTGTTKLLLLHRSNIERCYLSKEDRKEYSSGWVAWPTTPNSRGAISKIRIAYKYFMDKTCCSNMARRKTKTEEFYRTLIFNRSAEGSDPPSDWGTMFSVIIDGPTKVPSGFTLHRKGASESERAMAYIEPFLNAIFHLAALPHILGISESGRLYMYSGGRLGKQDLGEYGIFVILGCNTPLLLEICRFPSNDNAGMRWPYYTVVGVAYVHDYMYGRVLGELDNGMLTLETLDLV
ncbi:hypothetical protein EG329_002289 [Mollisiaceae sp. DMI_Dod_QoI]|nr:hypothetical protein EG329_002289 [Helotiales sp. DMI_Dod_QoI]